MSPRDAVMRYGANTTSFQTLGPGYSYFETDAGVVAYVDTGLAWVAAGDPLCVPEHANALAMAFCGAARRARRGSCFFATERAFVRSAASEGFRSVLVGEQPVFDPARWPDTLRARSSLREQRRRARAKGVRVRQLSGDALREGTVLRAQIAALLTRFTKSRRMAQMAFLVQLDPFGHLEDKVVFVAEREGEVVGYLGIVPIPARNGWFLEHLIRDRRSPNGTAELLFDGAMTSAHAQGIAHATLGLAPLSGPIPRALAMIRDGTRWLYDFRGLRRFKEKLGPIAYEPVYITRPPWHSTPAAVIVSLQAFAAGGFLVFGLRTLARRPKLVAALVFLSAIASAALACLFR